MKKLIILGAGGAGCETVSIVDCINRIEPTWNILGFLDDNKELEGNVIMGYKVLGTIDACISYPDAFFVSSIAHPNNRGVREKIYHRVKKYGGRFATIVHPTAVISGEVTIGEGAVVHANTCIGAKAIIDTDACLSFGCNIGHETVIGEHCALGAGVNLSGGVVVGKGCYIGCGVSCTHDISIEADTLVTVGTSVVRSIKNTSGALNHTWIGNPAENSYLYMRKQNILDKLARNKRAHVKPEI